MKVCIAGKSYVAVEALLYAIELVDKSNIVVCPNKYDVGVNDWQPSLKKVAMSNGIKVVRLEQLYHIEALVFISLEFDRIIDTDKFKSHRLFNIHFSKLPAYKGVYTSAIPILRSERETGVTLHKIDKGIDTGDIIDQIKFDIDKEDSAFSLYLKYNKYGLRLFRKNLKNILNDKFNSKMQDTEKASYYSRKSIDYSNLHLDTNKTAYEIDCQIRAFNFRVYQQIKFENSNLSHARISDVKSVFKPGYILDENEQYYLVSSIDYNIYLYKDNLKNILNKIGSNNQNSHIKNYIISGYNVSEKINNGWDLGIIAGYLGNWEILDNIIDSKYDIFEKNSNGTNLLMYVISSNVEKGKLEMITKLLDLELSPFSKDYSGITTFEYLYKRNRKDLINHIEKNLV
jgi:methionyl-tRNA formyltransferase